MTLVIALVAKDGIIMAGDTRGTIGDPRGLTAISDVHKKIFELSRYCGIGISGSSELGTALFDGIQKKLSDSKAIFVREAMSQTRLHVRALYNDWFSQFPIDKRPTLLLTIAGYDEIESRRVPKVYLLNSQLDYAPMLFDKGICMIGIPQYATICYVPGEQIL
jgi:20S proteasome alpha/beta subunit